MPVAKFGERLRRERESRGITLDQIAEATKISSRNLRALEEENFSLLPGGIFNKGFVRSYARFLGIDEEKAVADYLGAAGEKLPASKIEGGGIPDPPPVPRKKESRKSSGSSAGFWVTALVLLGIALGLGGWKYYQQYKIQRAAQVARMTNVNPTPVASMPTEDAAATDLTVPEPEETGALTPTSVPAQPAPENEVAGSSTSVVVELFANQDSWVKLTIDGSIAAQETLKAGTVRSFSGAREIKLVAGNAAGVEVSVNGKKIGALGPQGVVRERTFTPDN